MRLGIGLGIDLVAACPWLLRIRPPTGLLQTARKVDQNRPAWAVNPGQWHPAVTADAAVVSTAGNGLTRTVFEERGDTLATDSADHDGSSTLGPLLALRSLTVANDNVLRWLAIGLGKKAVAGGQMALVLTIGTAGFVLPFVLLAWLAGWLAARYPKRSVSVWCKLLEILIAAAAAAAVAWGVRSGAPWQGLPGGLWLLLATVIAIGCQAALMAPSVIGTIPESVSAARLPHANGLFAAVTLAATLV
ncbi:MAG: hypothetical protein ACKOTB_10675, partial [Planctomycetia bacterium]